MKHSQPPLANSIALALAQLRELSQREITSAAVAFPAILTVAWVMRHCLNGTFNRRHLIDELERHFQIWSRYGTGFSIILLDIDHFKSINDTFGHQTGDLVLIGLTQRLEKDLRDIEIFGRWGGEEFLCILPNTKIPEAVYCAERLRASLESTRLVETRPDLTVTASFGVGTCQPGETIDTLLHRVDALLYAAKAAGRNCINGKAGETRRWRDGA